MYDISLDKIIDSLIDPIGKKLVAEILDTFIMNELTYKVKPQWKPVNSLEREGYTVYCYIKKSKVALIINTRYFKIQLRITDYRTFELLDDYSENVRSAILVDSVRSDPTNTIDDGSYVFMYNGEMYRLCYQLCENFVFRKFANEDIDSIMDIICREIAFNKPKK